MILVRHHIFLLDQYVTIHLLDSSDHFSFGKRHNHKSARLFLTISERTRRLKFGCERYFSCRLGGNRCDRGPIESFCRGLQLRQILRLEDIHVRIGAETRHFSVLIDHGAGLMTESALPLLPHSLVGVCHSISLEPRRHLLGILLCHSAAKICLLNIIKSRRDKFGLEFAFESTLRSMDVLRHQWLLEVVSRHDFGFWIVGWP